MSIPTLLQVTPRLRVRDVERAAQWYRENLGFEIGDYALIEDGKPGFVIIERQSARIQLTRIPDEESVGNPEGTHNPGGAYFYVQDVDGLREELRQRGVPVLYEIETFSYGMREFAVVDSDGHYLGFGEPRG